MDFEDVLIDVLDGTATFNFNMAIDAVIFSVAALWLLAALWVWIDSGERSDNMVFRVLSTLLALVFNFVGVLIYLTIRPTETIEGAYWGDLERRYLAYETADLGDCESCGSQLSPGFNVCPQCAHPVRVECKGCTSFIKKEWAYCPHCAQAQEHRWVHIESSSVPTPTVNAHRDQRAILNTDRSRSHVPAKKSVPKVALSEQIGKWVIDSYNSVLGFFLADTQSTKDRTIARKVSKRSEDSDSSKKSQKQTQSQSKGKKGSSNRKRSKRKSKRKKGHK